MKRVVVFFVVLVGILSATLYVKLRERRLAAGRPSGGSATAEGVEVAVVSRLSARILEVKVEEGDAVKAGDVLVVLDCTEPQALLTQADVAVEGAELKIQAAETQLLLARQGVRTAQRQSRAAGAAAEATRAQRRALALQAEAARRAATRVETVRASGAISEQALDRAVTEASGMEQQLQAVSATSAGAAAQAAAANGAAEAASLQVQLAGVAVDGARRELAAAVATRTRAAAAVAECTLEAPRAGIVESRAFEPGEAVLPGSRVLTLVDAHEIRATFYLPNAELGEAAPGRPVEVVADAYRGRRFQGVVRRVASAAEFTPRNVQTREDRDRLVYAVEVAVPNPDGALRPGMPVEVTIPRQAR